MSTHQPEHALRVADRVLLLGQGHFAAAGTPREVTTPARLAAIYGIDEAAVTASLPGYFRHPADATMGGA
jgi:iron complex transport system ATP-binding protein